MRRFLLALVATFAVFAFMSSCDDGGNDGDCCMAECTSTLGEFQFMSNGEPVQVSGQVTITDSSTDEVLFDTELDGLSEVRGYVDESLLVSYEDATMEVRVEVEAEGYETYDQTFSLVIERTTVCCTSCLVSNEIKEIELIAP